MRPKSFQFCFRYGKGSALVIVLAFVVLLTGLVVAFFSRALSDRGVSTSSASQTKVELFAQGARDQIICDLREEIIAGSTNSVITTGTVTTTLYLPKTAVNMVPQLVGSSGTNGAQNLLKVSLSGSASYSGGTPRASGAVITGTSLNGRTVTPARWNKPLLLPATSGTDATPSGTFTFPDWILVARDGSTPAPTTWSSTLATSSNNSTSIVGRYAYTIYDEGGLLDANVAGYPQPSATSPAQYGYKPAVSYADLTQIGLTTTQVNQLVSWRNSASTQTSGTSFSSPNFTVTSGSNYFNSVLSNPNGFLGVSGTTLNNNGTMGATGQSDRMFSSRQQLIDFLRNGIGLPITSPAFQCLSTFSRALSQPSYVKAQSVNSSLLGYDSSAPQIQTVANGGNNQATFDAYVNPSFPAVRVSGTFTRNDGSIAVVGEPLVKRRFALNRLAWLTYQGPSAARTQSDPDIQTLINTYGIPWSFLQQGTAANIQKYFGLTWVADSGSSLGEWMYNVHNGASGTGPTGSIMRLGVTGDTGGITALSGTAAHEPDFFELLKASVGAGSKAKAETVSGGTLSPPDVQSQRDVSFDYSIIQLGANIIAQSKVDGYGVRIAFNDGVLPAKVFAGVENNPYLYRVRWGVLKIRNESFTFTGNNSPVANNVTGATPTDPNSPVLWYASQGILTDPGVCMLMLIPEIWNPHDQNAPIPALHPTNFRIVADSIDPDDINASNYSGYGQISAGGQDTDATHNPVSTSIAISSGVNVPLFSQAKGGAGTVITGGYAGYLHPLIPSDTAMTFTIPNAGLFREPTLLARVNVPAGSNLKIDSSNWSTTAPDVDYKAIATSTGVSFSNGGFTADVANPLVLPTPPATTTAYVGIPVGLFPSEWVGGRLAFETPTTMTNIYHSTLAAFTVTGVAPAVTYRLQYQDPTNSSNWVTYDTKYVSPDSAWTHNILGTSSSGGMMQAIDTWASFTDPRTSRFGGITTVPATSVTQPYNAPGSAKMSVVGTAFATSETTDANSLEWIDPTNDVLISNRPTYNGGYFVNSVTSQAGGWYSSRMIQGLLTQNSTAIANDGLKYSGIFGTDPYGPSGAGGANYYSDADTVVRRGMAGYVPASTTVGLPMAATYTSSGTIANQSQSRPWILHRPFRSVAELGYVFSDTPWKNLDFFTPESGDAALLDVFCINDTNNVNGIVAGKIDLNTRQAPVLKAILSNAYTDEQTPGTAMIDPTLNGAADQIVSALIQRTNPIASGTTQLTNISELVGKWVTGSSTTAPINGSAKYDGFSKDLSGVFTTVYGANTAMTNIQRFHEAVMRPLANTGQTRVWNLMIDVVAQTGRYPKSVTGLGEFLVEGEQRYWVHVAIDRLTGQVIDKQTEVVKE